MAGGGFPFHPIQAELRASGITSPLPPIADASRLEVLRELWTGAGLEAIETREISVRRSFADFEEFWSTSTAMGSMRPALAAMAAGEAEQLKERVRSRLLTDASGDAAWDASGRVTHQARANAIKGRVPKSS
jgi:hypothetical protein